MSLSQEQIDFFNEHGYLRYGKILEDAELDLLRREYDAEFAKANETGAYRNLAISDTDDNEKKQQSSMKMLQILNLGNRNFHFQKLWYAARLLDIVQDLMSPNIQLFHDQALFKPAHHGGPVFWHQDNAYWKCRPASLISVWMTLDEVDRENGAMQVIPGSHLKPVWHESADSTNALLDIEKVVDKSKAVVVDLPAGGCMFHHCQTLHYTQPNTTDRQRRAFIIHYMTPGTRRLAGDTLKPMAVAFDRPILRLALG